MTPIPLFPPRRILTADEREALQLLARSQDGCRQSIMLARGLMIGTLENLVRASLATAELRSIIVTRRAMLVPWLKITDAGRRALGTGWTLR
jgi:hypothetical protein